MDAAAVLQLQAMISDQDIGDINFVRAEMNSMHMHSGYTVDDGYFKKRLIAFLKRYREVSFVDLPDELGGHPRHDFITYFLLPNIVITSSVGKQ